MKILAIRDHHAEVTQCVRDHVEAFALSRHQIDWARGNEQLDGYDAVMIHYSMPMSIRLPTRWTRELKRFTGLKIAIRQDEYQNTNLLRYQLEECGVNLVFTCVPPEFHRQVYGPMNGARFVQVLTGYVPEWLEREAPTPIADRTCVVAYRGRELSPAYGRLGRQKYTLAVAAREVCQARGWDCDIETSTEHRLQKRVWTDLLRSSRAVLGTESGANVFDWDNALASRFGCAVGEQWRSTALWEDQYAAHVAFRDDQIRMNQVSPRVFEAAALGTAMIMIEGSYSGVVEPHEHYVPVREDMSNLGDAIDSLRDISATQVMADRARRDIVDSGQWSYRSFVERFDREVEVGGGVSA